MQNKKTFFLIIVLLLIGCAKTSSTSKSKEVDIYVGFDGLVAEFAKNAPPARVLEQSSFPILLKIRNKGAYSINELSGLKGILSIGREKDFVPKVSFEYDSRVIKGDNENEVYFYVDGKTQLNPNGDEIIISAAADTGKLDPQSEYRTSTITVNLCYPYKSVLSATVCIDPDVAGIRPGKKVCNVKELVLGNGQGAPVAITRIEPQMLPDVNKKDIIIPQFLIFIENKGKGTPVDISNYVHACRQSDATAKSNIWNVAYLTAYLSTKDNQLECTPGEATIEQKTGFIRFRDKKDFVRCTLKQGIERNKDAYLSPLRIEIDYGYIQTIATNFVIQKPLKY